MNFTIYTKTHTNTQAQFFYVKWVPLQLFWPDTCNFCQAVNHSDHYGDCANLKDIFIYKGLFNNVLWNETDDSLQWKLLHVREIWKLILANHLAGKCISKVKKKSLPMWSEKYKKYLNKERCLRFTWLPGSQLQRHAIKHRYCLLNIFWHELHAWLTYLIFSHLRSLFSGKYAARCF